MTVTDSGFALSFEPISNQNKIHKKIVIMLIFRLGCAHAFGRGLRWVNPASFSPLTTTEVNDCWLVPRHLMCISSGYGPPQSSSGTCQCECALAVFDSLI